MPFLSFVEPGGPFAVGQEDAMWMNSAGDKLVVRIFYPADASEAQRCSSAAWMPPSTGSAVSYAESYAQFFWKPGVTSAVVGGIGFNSLMRGVSTCTLAGAALTDKVQKLTPIIFSHGLGGNRSCYSAICTEMASHGYLVICPEHSDGSASISVLPDKSVVRHKIIPGKAVIEQKPSRIPGGFTRTLIPEEQPRTLTQYEVRNRQLAQRTAELVFVADCLDFIASGAGVQECRQCDGEDLAAGGAEGGRGDGSIPTGDGGGAAEALAGGGSGSGGRPGQRKRDVVYSFFSGLVTGGASEGEGKEGEEETVGDDPAGRGGGGGRRRMRCELPQALRVLVGSGRIDVARIGAVGHSFGAATCLSACARDPRFTLCIAHDPWLFPLDRDIATTAPRVPTLFLLADTFDLLWPGEGAKCIEGFQRRDEQGYVHVVHVRGTRHQNYSDFPLLAPGFCRAIGSITDTDPDHAMAVIHALDISFAAHVFGPSAAVMHLRCHVADDASEAAAGEGSGGQGRGREGESGAGVRAQAAWAVPASCREMARVCSVEDDGDGEGSRDLDLKIGAWTHDAYSEQSSGSKLGLQKGGA